MEERQRIKDEEANMKEKIQKEIMEDKKNGMLDNLNFMESTTVKTMVCQHFLFRYYSDKGSANFVLYIF